ncbi:unnamed protein product [Prunus armeniaca]
MNPFFTLPHQPDVSQHLEQSHPLVDESPFVIPVDESNNSSTIHMDHHNSALLALPQPVSFPLTLPIAFASTEPDSSVTAHPSPLLEPTCHSTRPTRPPIWRCDYKVSYDMLHTQVPLSDSMPNSMKGQIELTSYDQAAHDPNWQQAMTAEITALEQNNMDPHVYKIKHHSDNTIEHYKARLVSKGYTQQEGLDYHETFSLTAKLVTIQCLLAIAAPRHWPLHQLNVQNAFLHKHRDEEVYMLPPLGFRLQEENLVCQLNKSLYGLKQASRNQFSKFSNAIKMEGFNQSKVDYSLFSRSHDSYFTTLLIYVDNIIITGNDPTSIKSLVGVFHEKFRIKDLGDLKYFLGIEVSRSKREIFISQQKYTLDILKDVGLLGACPYDFPMEQKLKLTPTDGDLLHDLAHYRRLVGQLIYLTVARSDIVYLVHILSQFMHRPRKPHLEAVLRVLRYLKGSPDQGLLFPSKNNLKLTAFCDSDWASCPTMRRSTIGYCTFLGDALISWKTKK